MRNQPERNLLSEEEEEAEVVEEAEAEVTTALSTREVEDKMPSRLSRRPKMTSQLYEHDDLPKIIKRVA